MLLGGSKSFKKRLVKTQTCSLDYDSLLTNSVWVLVSFSSVSLFNHPARCVSELDNTGPIAGLLHVHFLCYGLPLYLGILLTYLLVFNVMSSKEVRTFSPLHLCHSATHTCKYSVQFVYDLSLLSFQTIAPTRPSLPKMLPSYRQSMGEG